MHQDLCMLQPAKDIIKFFKKIKETTLIQKENQPKHFVENTQMIYKDQVLSCLLAKNDNKLWLRAGPGSPQAMFK